MKEEPFKINYISGKDCFLHLPNQYLQNVKNTGEKKCLKIQYGIQKFAFLSWCDQPFITEDSNCIGLNATYAQILGIKDQEEILLSSYTQVTSVRKMYVCVLTPEEWEIMEANINAVQSSLLDQIRVVWPGQILVVWVSKYLHFSLRVDSIEPNYKVGILEQYTDLAVVIPPSEEAQSESTTVKYALKLPEPNNTNITSTNNDSLMQDDSKTGNSHEAHQNNGFNRPVSHEIWDTIKGLFSFDLPGSEQQSPSRNVNALQEIPGSSLVPSKKNVRKNICVPYRVHPLPRLKPKAELARRSDILLSHPFRVFVHRCNLPKFACINDQLICKLTKCVSSINSKVDDKHLKHDKHDTNEGKSSSVPAHAMTSLDTVYVQLCVIEDLYDNISFELKEQFKEAAAYSEHHCILVSSTVYRCLHLKTGSRVNLSFESCKGKPLSSIKITPLGKWNIDKKDIKAAFQDYLSSLTTYTNLVINSNVTIQLPVKPKLHNEVLVQLLPKELEFAVVDAKTLTRCNIDVTESASLSDVDIVAEKTKDTEDPSRPTTYFGKNLKRLISEGLITMEMSLCLKPFFYGPLHAKFHLISNMLILGKLGSGKTTLARHLSREVEKPPYYVHCVTVQCKALKGKKVETLHKMLMQWANECIYHQPSILLLDDVDAIAGTSASEEQSAEEAYFFRIGDMLANILEDVQRQNYVVVVATAPSISKLTPSIAAARGQHFFKTLLDIPDLSKSDRLETMKAVISQKTGLSSEDLLTLDLSNHAAKAEGYVIQDIADMVDKAVFEGWKRTYSEAKDVRKGMVLKACDVAQAMHNNVPLALRGVTLHKDSTHTWADVGGLMEVKRELIEVLQWPSQYMDLFAKCPLRHQSGLLLYGAPGTGKTLLAAAVSQECGLNFTSVKGPELLSKYIGASEEAVRNIFQKAQSARPCVLFFDEFDSLAPRRGHDSTGVTDRVVNQLLTQLDGVESLTGVWVVAATSRPDLLDPALLRPGRLDKAILCSLPGAADRTDILRALSRRLALASDVDLGAIASGSAGFTGADLQAVLYTAQLMAVEEQQKVVSVHDLGLAASSGGGTAAAPPPMGDCVVVEVTQSHLLAALADTRPSLPPGEKLRYQTIYDAFIGARKGKRRNLEVVPQRATLA